jgi:D-alanine-D-alanine ligase
MAVIAHTALGLRDISRTDLIVDEDGLPHFLEVNVAPGMTETSLFPMAAEAAGEDFGTLCRVLLEQAAARGA